jgi:membrane protein implicated in regulation of membrane protease activity
MFQSVLGFLIAWYNLPYTIFLGLGLIIAALQLLGLNHDGDSDMDADADLDVDVDADLDVDADVDADLDMDHDLDVDHDVEVHSELAHDASAGSGSGLSWLAFIGFGKAPLMVVLLILLFSMGLLGWVINGVIFRIFGIFPSLLILLSGLLSIATSIFITSRITLLIGRALPPISSTATKAQAMVGMNGVVTSPFVDDKYGMVRLRDAGGTQISLFAITEDENPIPRGESVILLTYDTVQKRFIVTHR